MSGTINQLRRSCQSVHLLVTSRDNAGLDESLNAMPTEIVDMRNEEGFRRDIVEWVNSRLYNHHTISRYPDKHDEIRSALIERAQYWWVFLENFFCKVLIDIISSFRYAKDMFRPIAITVILSQLDPLLSHISALPCSLDAARKGNPD